MIIEVRFENGKWYVTGCGNFETKTQAYAAVETFRSLNPGIEIWLYKKNGSLDKIIKKPRGSKVILERVHGDIRPHRSLELVRPDVIAECWEGVGEMYSVLWRVMGYAEPYTGETPPEPDVNSVASLWQHFTPEEKKELNRIAAEHEKQLDELYGSMED
jgi:hypothetical protein